MWIPGRTISLAAFRQDSALANRLYAALRPGVARGSYDDSYKGPTVSPFRSNLLQGRVRRR